MSFSDRLHHAAVRGCLIAAFFLTLSQNNQREGYGVEHAAATEQADAAKPATTHFALGLTVDAQTYRAICEQPKDKDHADLCQQWRVAEAAESQILMNILGLLLLGGTLVFTGWTAVAASRAARAAQKSADSVPNIERAYVFFWDVERKEFGFLSGERTVRIPTEGQRVIYKNCGKTPAIITRTRLDCEVFASPPVPQSAPERELPSGAVVAAAEEWPRGHAALTKEKINRAKAENLHVYLFGEITYRDIFDTERRTWFCRRWNGTQFVLADLADKKLNGHT